MRVGGVGEEVVRLGRPGPFFIMQRFQVARWRRVEGVHRRGLAPRIAAEGVVQARVDVLDEFVEVLVPRVGVLDGNSIIKRPTLVPGAQQTVVLPSRLRGFEIQVRASLDRGLYLVLGRVLRFIFGLHATT